MTTDYIFGRLFNVSTSATTIAFKHVGQSRDTVHTRYLVQDRVAPATNLEMVDSWNCRLLCTLVEGR